MEIPFLDLARIDGRREQILRDAADRVLKSGWYILGKEVEEFENRFAAYCGVKHCVGTANGLDALILMLRAAQMTGDLRAGDEIIVPANTYIATVLAVSHAGLTPVPAEIDPETFNLNAETVAAAAHHATRVRGVIGVHLYGRLCPMEELGELCRRQGWLLFEDAAQSHGARSGKVAAGNGGDAAAFSFYPSKNLGALGDGGAVTTDDDRLADIVRCLRNYGTRKKYQADYLGVNSRLDELQAALLAAKLPELDAENGRRREIALRYIEGINHPQVRLPSLPAQPSEHVWHLFVVCCPQRKALQEHLAEQGVGTVIHYPTVPHRQAAYADTPFAQFSCPVSEWLAGEVLSLPLSPALTDEEAEFVVEAVNAFPG